MKETSNLQLSLKKQWFEMTKQVIKTEDYREINDYWCKRLLNKGCYEFRIPEDGIPILTMLVPESELFRSFDINTMTSGYPKSTDTERILKLEHKGIEISTGNPEWGAEEGNLYFVIKHGKILE